MTSISPPRKPNKWDDIIRVFFIIVLIGTIILLALGYISWKVVAGLFILVLILIWLMIIREDRVQECAIEWDEKE